MNHRIAINLAKTLGVTVAVYGLAALYSYVLLESGVSLGGRITVHSDRAVNGRVATDGGVTAHDVSLSGLKVGDVVKIYKDGELVLNMDDEVQRGVTVTLEGAIMWPPPPVQVSAAPKKDAKSDSDKTSDSDAQSESSLLESNDRDSRTIRGLLWKALLGVAAVGLVVAAPAEMTAHFFVFVLACVIGFYVITNVTHTLHTPLMSVTNAISGIIIVGALLLVGSDNIVVVVHNWFAGTLSRHLNIAEGVKCPNVIVDLRYNTDELENPLINNDQAVALGLASYPELQTIDATARKINDILLKRFSAVGINLID